VIRLSDPKPAYCSACHNAPAGKYVDFDAAHDGGDFTTQDLVWHAGSDDLHLCAACLKRATEVLGFKPELNQRQLREIRRLEVENEHWRDYARTLEATLQERPEPAPRQHPAAVA
jgi:hypothetical protein